MSKRGSDISGREEDARLEKALLALAPTVTEQELVEAQPPSQAFVETLRARLVDQPERRSFRLPRVPRLAIWTGVPAVAAVAIAAVLFLAFSNQKAPVSRKQAALALPTPLPQDLTKSYPLTPGLGGGGLPNPVISRIEFVSGNPYPGHISITGHPNAAIPLHPRGIALKPTPGRLAQYVALLAGRLGIPGKVVSTRAPEFLFNGRRTTTYFYVSRGTGASPASPIRSVAVSSFDGHVVIHKELGEVRAGGGKPIAAAEAVRKARSFLERLGWPGASMPLLGLSHFPGAPQGSLLETSKQVNLGFPGAESEDRPAASMWVARDGSITEALLFPREAKSGTVALRSLQSAWNDVQAGKVAVGISTSSAIGTMATTFSPTLRNKKAPGVATLSATSLEYIVTTSPSGRMYLVPAYRFTGAARIRGAPGQYRWIALVPALK
jgi:hypothetical protein